MLQFILNNEFLKVASARINTNCRNFKQLNYGTASNAVFTILDQITVLFIIASIQGDVVELTIISYSFTST